MVSTLEENWLINGYKHLEAAGVDSENIKKEMEEFLRQIEENAEDSTPSTSKTVEKDEFKIVISFNEEEDEEESDDSDFVVNKDIE